MEQQLTWAFLLDEHAAVEELRHTETGEKRDDKARQDLIKSLAAQ
jgi:hypothetical protein